jgi:FkbM family methyltransferase
MIWVRPGTCDVILYYDIIINNHYGNSSVQNPKTIIDCGANIGISCAYFLCRYPNSRLIAIEPDPVNYGILIKNLAPFCDRSTILRAALWGKNMPMSVEVGNIGTWASTVSVFPMDDSSETIEGLDFPTLLNRYDCKSVDILKIDIEGAEYEVFSAENLDWINQIKCFQIEIENEDCRKVFMKALSQREFSFSQYSEITIAVQKNGLAEPN